MVDGTRLTTVETVREEDSWLFTVRDPYDEPDEVILVPCDEDGTEEDGESPNDDGVRAWVNRCTHEAQRLDRGFGAAMRDGEIICPKHGSMFDACSGYCDNGHAADTTLVDVGVAVEDGDVFLADDGYEFVHEGSIDDGGGATADETGDADAGEEDGGTAIDGSTPSWATDDDDDDAPGSTSHISL